MNAARAAHGVGQSAWWRANRWWLLALCVVLPIAIASASFNWWVVRSSSSFSDPQTAQLNHLDFRPADQSSSGVAIDLDAATTVARGGGYRATSGVVDLWQITVTFSRLGADSDELATLCQFRLVDAEGREYAPGAGLTYRSEDQLSTAYQPLGCTNLDDKPSWSLTQYFGVPAGTAISQLHIQMGGPPSYARFPLAAR